MGLFGWVRNNDGASSLAESINNISTKDWRALQDRARKANPDLDVFGSDQMVRRARIGRDNLRNAENC